MKMQFEPNSRILSLLSMAVLGAGTSMVCAQQSINSSGPAAAASTDTLAEVVVTARRREESEQHTPVSVAAISPEALQQSDVQRPADLSKLVAGLVTVPTPSFNGGSTAFIRGIGSTESSLAVDPSIGTYRDGIYLGHGSTSGNADLTTVDHVEVLRGPQGTLFGRNTTGGAINVVTRAPLNDFGVSEMLRYGSFSEIQSTTTVDSGILGATGVSGVATFTHHQRNGYISSPLTGDDRDPGAYSYDSVFAKVRGQWGRFSADYVFDLFNAFGTEPAFQLTAAGPTTSSYFGNSPSYGGAPLVVSPDRLGTIPLVEGLEHTKIWGNSLTAQFAVNDDLTLKSISAWRRFSAPTLPFDAGNAGLLGLTTASPLIPVPVSVFFTSPKRQDTNQFTEEAQVLGNAGPVAYTAGLFYLHETGGESNVSNLDFPISPTLAFPTSSLSLYTIDNTSKAAYGQLSYKPTFLDRAELTAGVRYTSDEKSVDETDSTADRVGNHKFINTTYSVSASYQWTPDIMTFVRVGSGVRAGGFNIRATQGEQFLFLPEKAQSEELGLKSQFWDNHVRINAGLFYTGYKDLQITEFTGVSAGGLSGQTYNANANYRGGELELAVIPLRDLTFSVNAGYVDPRYNQIFLVNPVTNLVQNYADQARFPYVPRWNANAAIDYLWRLPLGTFRAHLDGSGMGKRYFHISNLSNQSPFNDVIASNAWGTFDARITWGDLSIRGAAAEISVWVDNVTDKFYRITGIDFGSAGFAGNEYNAPRTAGVDLKVKF